MKRVQYDRYGGPGEMYVGEYSLPQLGDNEVRVSTKAAGINPFDWKIRLGAMKFMTGRRFPKGMGTDFAGIVEEVGKKVSNVQVGDEVFGSIDFKKSGSFAESLIVDAPLVTKKPSNMSFSEAACLLIPATTAWAAIIDIAKAKPGSRILIHGCSGAVGAFAARMAAFHGAHVAGACGASSADTAKAAGVSEVFGYSDTAKFAQNGKFDAIFDTIGTLDVGAGVSMLKPKGVFVDINPTGSRAIRGFLSRRYKLAFATMGTKHIPAIADLARDGILPPTIGLEAPFADAVATITNLEAGSRVPGRVVLVF